MRPSLDGEIGLGIEAHAKNDNCEEAGDIARKLPVLPLSGLARWWRSPAEEVAVGSLLVTWTGPSARTIPASPCSE